jgi:hypothetical protein
MVYRITYNVVDGDGETLWSFPSAWVAVMTAARMVHEETLGQRRAEIVIDAIKASVVVGARDPEGSFSPCYNVIRKVKHVT